MPLSDRNTTIYIRLLEGENPSNSVSLFVWSPGGPLTRLVSSTRGTARCLASGRGKKSAEESIHQFFFGLVLVGRSLGRVCSLPPGKTVSADRYPISPHQPICKRKMNACWTPDTFVHGSSRTHEPTHERTHTCFHSIELKRFDDEHQSPSHPASSVTISAPAPLALYDSNRGRPAAVESGNLSRSFTRHHRTRHFTCADPRRYHSPCGEGNSLPLHNRYGVPQL